ncbi:MAG: AI-2E family transporter [Propionibacteriaceae bacterium]|nr:AI-2E family transporter [Propionibacteriaceae bacterium]
MAVPTDPRPDEPLDDPHFSDDIVVAETITQVDQEETTGAPPRNRKRVRKLVRRVFGDARRGAQTLLTPVPNEPIAPVPPTAVSTDSRLLRHSPFSIGFFGAIGVLVAWALAMAVMEVQGILILVVMALFLALGLSPAVDFLARRRVPRGLAVFLVTVAALGVIASGFTALVPILTEQAQSLVKNLPGLLNNLRQNKQIADLDREFGIIEQVRQFLTSGTLLQNLFGGIWGAGRILANVVFSLIMTLVLTIYFLASLPSIKEIIYHLAPASRRPRARYLADEIFGGVSGYITGMFLIVTVASVSSFIYMNIAGLGQYSLALAFVVALFCFIPIIGSSLAMVVVAIVAFATNPTLGIVTIIYFLIYQQFDAYVLYPNILKRTVKVPGALVILSAIIGGTLLGIIGAVIAIPTTAALLLLYREVVQPHLDTS